MVSAKGRARSLAGDNSKLLKSLIKLYFTHRNEIVELEGETAYAALGAKYVEELRHAFHDLMTALKAEDNPDKQHELLHETRRHLESLSPSAYQHVAGIMLTDARVKIEEAGILQGPAVELYNQALRFWEEGRKKRSENPTEGVHDFRQSIKLAKESILHIATFTKRDRISIIIAIITIIFGAVGLYIGYLSLR